MASREGYTSVSNEANFFAGFLYTRGTLGGYNLYSITITGATTNNSATYGLSPVISLKNTIKVTGGSGTSSSPYTLGT